MWRDSRFAWKAEDYENLFCIQRHREKHWYPHFELFSASDVSVFSPQNMLLICSSIDSKESQKLNASVSTHFFNLFRKFEILCNFNVYKFPFDNQVCSFVFSPYLFTNTSIHLTDYGVDPTVSYQPNNEWELKSVIKTFTTKSLPLAVRLQNRSVMEFRMHFRRRSMSYVGTIFVPTSALGLLSLMVFVIPVESGEKISLGISVFLAFSVFQLIFVDSLPQSNTLPIVGKFLFISRQKCGFFG